MSGENHATVQNQRPSTGSAGPEGPPEVPRVQDLFAQCCHAILKKCQEGSMSFTQGVTEIVQEATQVAMDRDQVQQVLTYFSEQYNQIRGSLAFNQNGRSTTVNTTSQVDGSPQDARDAARSPSVRENPVPQGPGDKRRRSKYEEFEEDKVSNSGEREFIQELVEEDLLPWRRPGFRGSIIDNQHPVLLEINRTLSAWNKTSQTWKAVYQGLLNKPRKPPFPLEQWKNIIQSKPVSLDRVLDRFQHDSITNEISERVGAAKISFNSEPIGKGVSCYLDWVTAWDETVVAYTYIWPSRDQELTAYCRHISSLFHSFVPVSHSHVIKYDRAIRTVTAETRSFLFHQVKYYPQLDRYWLTGAVPASSNGDDKSKHPKKRSAAPCRNFNLGVCPNDTIECPYRHVCIDCASSGHTRGSIERLKHKGKGKAGN